MSGNRARSRDILEKQDEGGAEAEAEAFRTRSRDFRTRSRDIHQKQALLKPGAETFLKSDDFGARNGAGFGEVK